VLQEKLDRFCQPCATLPEETCCLWYWESSLNTCVNTTWYLVLCNIVHHWCAWWNDKHLQKYVDFTPSNVHINHKTMPVGHGWLYMWLKAISESLWISGVWCWYDGTSKVIMWMWNSSLLSLIAASSYWQYRTSWSGKLLIRYSKAHLILIDWEKLLLMLIVALIYNNIL